MQKSTAIMTLTDLASEDSVRQRLRIAGRDSIPRLSIASGHPFPDLVGIGIFA